MSEKAKDAIIRYFKEFGREFGEGMYDQLAKPGGMARLLKRYKLYDPGNTADQYAMLLNHFRRVGPDSFLEMIGKKPLEFKLEIQPESRETRERRTELQLREHERMEEVRKVYRARTKNEDEETRRINQGPEKYITPKIPPTRAPGSPARALNPNPVPTSGYRGEEILAKRWPMDKDGYPVGPLIPGEAPDPAKLSSSDLSWDPKKPYNPLGTWPEVERRSGKERRRHSDRRKDVDIVFKNKRFGKDRRNREERRKNWPKDGFRK